MPVCLAQYTIYPFTAQFAAIIYQFHIIGGYHYRGIFAYMVGGFVIFGTISGYFFFTLFPFAGNYFISLPPVKLPLYPEAIQALLHAVLLVRAEVTLCITEVVHGIEQVGFATAVGACNTGYRAIETEPAGAIVAKLY